MGRWLAPLLLLLFVALVFIAAATFAAWRAGDLRNPFEPTPTQTNIQLPTI